MDFVEARHSVYVTTLPTAGRDLFLLHLSTIQRAIRFCALRSSLRPDHAEDFSSWAMLKLIENDYRVIAEHDGKSSFPAFISVVVHRLLLDYRNAQWGKWRASAKAIRMGDAAVVLEAMLYRDGLTTEEVIPALRRRWPDLTRQDIERLATDLPPRLPKPRVVGLAAAEHASVETENALFSAERESLARSVADVVRRALRAMDSEQRLLLRLRFEGEMSVAEISRALQIDQKPIYRKIERALVAIRKDLQEFGIGDDDLREVLSCGSALDFGFEQANAAPLQRDEEPS